MFKKIWPLLIVIIAGILASHTLLFQKGYFNMHDDLQMMRQLEMEKCFEDGQIPCRWVPDMGYKYGFPLFNFYPPLPYLVGQVIRVFGFAFTDTVKILFAISIIASGVGMYLLAREFFNKIGGILSAIFYIWAPYHAVDVYVRGAMNESWALIFFPFIFLFGYKLITDTANRSRSVILLALSYAGLFMSHNLMVMIFTPFFILWCVMWLWLTKKDYLSSIKYLILSGTLSLGLSAYFTLPAIFENKLTWLKSQLIGYYDYSAHFVDINQLLISRFWGYGPSIWLERDGMPFPAGHIHWGLSIIIIAVLLYSFFINKKKNKKSIISNTLLIVVFLFLMGWLSSFMTHVRSTPVYQSLPFLALVQFPWRFLTLVSFAFSFLAGAVYLIFEQHFKKRAAIYSVIIAIGVIMFNWNYFLPQDGKMGKLTDEEKFSGEAWQLQLTAGIYDYLPLTAKMAPKAPQKELAEVMEGNAEISNMEQGTDWAKFNVKANGKVQVRINIFEFPSWEIKIDGNKINQYMPEGEEWGRMWIEVPGGEHEVTAQFTNTPIRTVSNYISLISWLGLLGYGVLQFRSGRRNRNRDN